MKSINVVVSVAALFCFLVILNLAILSHLNSEARNADLLTSIKTYNQFINTQAVN